MITPLKLNVRYRQRRNLAWAVVLLVAVNAFCVGEAADAETERRLKELEQQNAALQQKLTQQQVVIDDLARKLSGGASLSEAEAAPKSSPFGTVRISGE